MKMAFPSFILHTIVGTTALIFCIFTIIFGAMIKGRFGNSKGNKDLLKFHKISGMMTGIFVILTNIFMVLLPLLAGTTLEFGFHGWVAISALIVVLIQIMVTLMFKKAPKMRKVHDYLGYLLLFILSTQIGYGLYLLII
jgi:hypothetical protein